MKFPSNIRALIVACLATVCLTQGSVQAGENYTFGKDEYVTVGAGRSPDGKYAIAAHGEGADGIDNFHLYLMDAKANKKIGPLEEITDTFGTDPGEFDAKWSRDSSEVAITYRVEKHVTVVIRYRIAKGRAFLISGPEAERLPKSGQ